MKWQSPGLGKSGLCFMFYNILEKEGASIFDTPSLLSMSGSIFTFLNGDCIDFIEDFRRDSEHLFPRIVTIIGEDL